MKNDDLKIVKSAAMLKGYFLDRQLPPEIRAAVDHLTAEIESILSDVNQIVEADSARMERERVVKRAERESMRYARLEPAINEPRLDASSPQINALIPDDELASTSNPTPAVAPPPAKRRKQWSPEAREAAAVRMRNMQAAKKAKAAPLGEAQAPSAGGA